MPIMIAPTAMQKMAHPEGIYACSDGIDLFRLGDALVKYIVFVRT